MCFQITGACRIVSWCWKSKASAARAQHPCVGNKNWTRSLVSSCQQQPLCFHLDQTGSCMCVIHSDMNLCRRCKTNGNQRYLWGQAKIWLAMVGQNMGWQQPTGRAGYDIWAGPYICQELLGRPNRGRPPLAPALFSRAPSITSRPYVLTSRTPPGDWQRH
jgi:hypothetical protein